VQNRFLCLERQIFIRNLLGDAARKTRHFAVKIATNQKEWRAEGGPSFPSHKKGPLQEGHDPRIANRL
jgi:hypothetical protein